MVINQFEFIKKTLPRIDKYSWFLGAGFSASAGLPTAGDVIWDLKKRYYCLHENQIFQNNDLEIQPIKNKVQAFCESRGFPELYADDEYTFYFDLLFGNNLDEQRKYIADILNTNKIKLSIGHRVLAALMHQNIAKVVYTTNFDKVLENAYSYISNNTLGSFHLEGAESCKIALDNDEFPLYAKIHGDFQYKRLANLEQHLISADENIRRCFLASTSRFGCVVIGYSGRDKCVMDLFKESLDVNNAYPHGFFWTVLKGAYINPKVKDLIEEARTKGIEAKIVEIDNFDSLMTRLWRNLSTKPAALNIKVEKSVEKNVSIPIIEKERSGNLLRLNAIPLLDLPQKCFRVTTKKKFDWNDIKDIKKLAKDRLVLWLDEDLNVWGSPTDIKYFIPGVEKIEDKDLSNQLADLENHKSLLSAMEELLFRSMSQHKELLYRKNTLFVSKDHFNSEKLAPLKEVVSPLGGKLKSTTIKDHLDQDQQVVPIWAQSLELRIKKFDDSFFLLMTPDIRISPPKARKENIDFLNSKRSILKNDNMDKLLTAWIKVIFSGIPQGSRLKIEPYLRLEDGNFITTTRTAYSRKMISR